MLPRYHAPGPARPWWERIVQLIAPDVQSPARRELDAVAGIACTCITDEAFAEDAVVVYGVGPRLRIYALYADDAIEGDGANESPLSYVPTDGDWHMSIPCASDDFAWVSRGLATASPRVTARVLGDAVGDADSDKARSRAARDSEPSVQLDRESFFRP